ncbi:SusC/RagA family TonB-linked outer membrane protein [Pedobacter sp. MC2016-14]|uniref:SusC/RagA family TonB-linked outer membrane protein n=1 Tax=Pedobacter sp. MC2016-14 TaxID=2897327 RepID=UPI001E59FD7A|nr:SusC/RagA family TonB-linked outer membrane protein [Pedobacter sp. MC2016-14]MCD0488697.1 SusC/RagA family TonB-linked outer membrane protein [Pedobacter sp. MC2016-14]
MKITTILIFAVLMQVSAAGLAQRVTFHQKGVSLKQIFNEINKQTGYNILWSAKKIKNDKLQDVQFSNASLEDVLSVSLKGLPLTYTIESKTIVIKEKQKSVFPEFSAAIQFKNIEGKVTDEKGMVIPGASVKVKGSTKGTVSGSDGKFVIDVVAGDVLVITSIGFTTTEVTVGNQTSLVIVLKEASNELDGVVVTALGIKRQSRTLTYNVQEISGEEVNRVKDANFVNSLVGKVAGATINSSSSGVGGSARVVLRGSKSITQNNNALYVIDGIPMPDLLSAQPTDVFGGAGQTGDGASNVNPDDIESISVLTGPSASALYGYQAANGVILITTKKGSRDGFSVNASNSTTFSSPFVMPKFQNTYGSEIGSYSSWGEKLATPSNYDPKDFFQTGVNSTTALNLSTGNEKNQTYFSFAAVNANGIIHNNDLDRYNFSFRNTSKLLKDKLTLDLGVNYTTLAERNMLSQGQYFNPLIPIYLFPRGDDIRKYQVFERYDATRNFKIQYWPFGDQGFQMQNPYWIIERDNFLNKKNRYQLTGSLKYDINSWLNVTGRVKMDNTTGRNLKEYSASTSGLFASDAGAYYKYDLSTNQVYADVLLNANKQINDFSLTGNLGVSLQDTKYEYSSLGGNLQSVPNLFTYTNLNLSQSKIEQSGYHDQMQSAFGSFQAGYKSMVYLDVTGRIDVPSQLAFTSANSTIYPSVGLSGIFTDIFKIKSDVLSFLKGRISYGEVGIPPRRQITRSTYPLSNGSAQVISFLAADLKAERTKSFEAGLNAAFFRNKLKIDATVYRSSTFDQLFNPTIPESYGYNSIFINAGRIDNKGIEVSATLNQKIGQVNWTSNVVYSLNRNTIKELLDGYTDPTTGLYFKSDVLDITGIGSYKNTLVKGGSMGDIYVNTLKTDEHGYIYVNAASQAVLPDQNTFIKAGNTNPDFNIGFRNGFSYKGFDVSVLVTGRFGGVGVSVTQAIMDGYGVSQASADARDAGGASVNGFLIPAQAYYQTVGGGTTGISSMYTYSATNIRLGEVSLGYDIPVAKYAKWIKGANVSLIGRNLFMFYNKAPYDPELTASTDTYFQGVDYFMQPSLRSYGFAIKFKF